MLRNPYQYQAVAARPNISVAEDGCPPHHHVATCNGFNASNTTTSTTTTATANSSSSSSSNSAACRACTVCGTTKTPLWRSGPQGPKSLCNACGIRARKMHERQHHFAHPPPQTLAAQQSSSRRPIVVIEGLPKGSQGTEVLIFPTGMISDGSKYEGMVWNHDVKIHGHHHTNLQCGEFHCIRHEDEDEDDDYHEEEEEEDDDDDDASDSCPSSSSSTPSQVTNKDPPLFPSIKHLSFKRKAPRSPSSTSQRHMQPKPLLSFSFSRDDEQAALLLMSLSHGLTLNNK